MRVARYKCVHALESHYRRALARASTTLERGVTNAGRNAQPGTGGMDLR
jgi:hypothetical protein